MERVESLLKLKDAQINTAWNEMTYTLPRFGNVVTTTNPGVSLVKVLVCKLLFNDNDYMLVMFDVAHDHVNVQTSSTKIPMAILKHSLNLMLCNIAVMNLRKRTFTPKSSIKLYSDAGEFTSKRYETAILNAVNEFVHAANTQLPEIRARIQCKPKLRLARPDLLFS